MIVRHSTYLADRPQSTWTWLFLGLAIVLFLPLPALAATSYTTTFTGPLDGETLTLLQEFSDTYQLQNTPPASLVHLRRRVNRDQERFLSTLQSLGHYGAKVTATTEGDASPYTVRFDLEPGPIYSIAAVHIEALGVPDGSVEMPSPAKLGLPLGAKASAVKIIDAESQLARYLQQQGYPFAAAGERRVLVDHAERHLIITLQIAAGERAIFGPIAISGLEKVDEAVILDRITWDEGDAFRREDLRQTQRALYDTGLFGLTSVTTAESVSPDGTLPIYIEVSERKHRTYAIGLRYDTDQGAGLELSWEHRNMRQLGHKLRVGTRLSTTVSELTTDYHIDQFRREDQRLVSQLRIAREDLDAYRSNLVSLTTLVERDVTPSLTVGAGLALMASSSVQAGRSQTHKLISAPLKMEFDKSNDLLNPTQGYRLGLRAEPFVGLFTADTLFFKADATFTHYLAFDEEAKWVLATRLRAGSIVGESLSGIPPSVRFFSGGGGSIRGFPYRTVSPLDELTPIGGRSTLEAAVELRRRLSDTLGLVTFVDAGSAFDSVWPDFGESIRYSAGIGVRYFTTIGPLRFDIAVPLNKRKGIDDSFEFYLSIGQAF